MAVPPSRRGFPCPRPAGDIASEFDLNRPAVSEHLQVLRNVGLVSEEIRGRQHFYHLNPPGLSEVKEWLHPFEHYWGPAR
jgi:DNA-binding transcriptional ArsR family regulator